MKATGPGYMKLPEVAGVLQEPATNLPRVNSAGRSVGAVGCAVRVKVTAGAGRLPVQWGGAQPLTGSVCAGGSGSDGRGAGQHLRRVNIRERSGRLSATPPLRLFTRKARVRARGCSYGEARAYTWNEPELVASRGG